MHRASTDLRPGANMERTEVDLDRFHAVRTRTLCVTAVLEPSLTVWVCPTIVGRAVTQTVTRILICRYVSEVGAAASTA